MFRLALLHLAAVASLELSESAEELEQRIADLGEVADPLLADEFDDDEFAASIGGRVPAANIKPEKMGYNLHGNLAPVPLINQQSFDKWGEQCLMPGLDLRVESAQGLDPAECQFKEVACETIGHQIGDEGAKELAAVLAYGKCKMVAFLGADNDIGPDGMEALAAAVHSGKTPLNMFNVDNNHVGTDGAVAMALALAGGNSKLRDIGLSGNAIGDEGAAALAAALAAESDNVMYLTSLGVNGNGIGDEGATALAAALATGATRIKSLGLANNEIGDNGAIALAEACARTKKGHFPHIEALHLNNNSIGDLGAILLASALQSGECSLTTLDLSPNKIGNTGAVALGKALRSGKSLLKKLYMWGNEDIGEVGKSALKEFDGDIVDWEKPYGF